MKPVAGALTILFALCLSSPTPAESPSLVPVLVHSRGPKAIQVEVADGSVMPCDSTDNRLLYRGWLSLGSTLTLASSGTVCFRQTYDDFPETNWSTSRTLTSEMICSGAGRGRVCRPDPAAKIRVEVGSTAPQ